MGTSGFNMLLNLAKLDQFVNHLPPDTLDKNFDFAYMAALNLALEEIYGERGGRGMALRVGRASFSQGMKKFGAFAGMNDKAFRSLPLDERCRMGLQVLANIFNKFSDQQSAFEEDSKAYYFTTENSPMAWGRRSERPVCHALAGIVQESVRWASNGREFYVYEISCRACGDPKCVFEINKTPIA